MRASAKFRYQHLYYAIFVIIIFFSLVSVRHTTCYVRFHVLFVWLQTVSRNHFQEIKQKVIDNFYNHFTPNSKLKDMRCAFGVKQANNTCNHHRSDLNKDEASDRTTMRVGWTRANNPEIVYLPIKQQKKEKKQQTPEFLDIKRTIIRTVLPFAMFACLIRNSPSESQKSTVLEAFSTRMCNDDSCSI